jgi:ABC-2 type transport system permease protein
MWQAKWIIARFEYLRRVKSKAFLFSLFIPIIILFLAMLPQYLAHQQDQHSKIFGIMDYDGKHIEGIQAHFEKNLLSKSGEVIYKFSAVPYSSENKKLLIRELIANGAFDALFDLRYMESDSALIDIYHQNLGVEELSRIQKQLNNYLLKTRISGMGLSEAQSAILQSHIKFREYELNEDGEISAVNPIVRYILPFMFLFVLVMGILTSAQSLVSSVIEERSNRIVEIILSSVPAKDLMGGKIVGMGLLGLTQIAFYMIIIIGIGSYGLPQFVSFQDIEFSKIGWYLIFFMLGYFLYSAIFITLGSFFDNERDAQQVTGIFSLVMIVPIYFIPYVMEHPDTMLTNILSLIPFVTPFFIILRAGIFGMELWLIVSFAIYLTVWIYIVYFIASRLFEVVILMYGKRYTFPEILRWLKAGKA